jgi:hypothetical protein
MTLKQLDVFTVNTDYLLDPAKVVSTFTAPGVMATIVVAEKGYDSTSELMPTQQQYRSDADWLVYRENLRRMSRGRRPHVVRSLGEISVTDVKSGHLFVAHDFTGRDPATEIKRLNRQPRPMERDELICEQQTRLDEFQRLLANKDALLISQQQRLAEAEAQFRAITNSRSWRVTAPMRTMLGWLRNGAAP